MLQKPEAVHSELKSLYQGYLAVILSQVKDTDGPNAKALEMVKKLEKIGAIGTMTYQGISKTLSEHKNVEEEMKTFQKKYQIWEMYKKAFPNAMFITQDQLIYLVMKYNLCIDRLDQYAKDIPLSTVDILEKVHDTIPKDYQEYYINYTYQSCGIARINRLVLNSDAPRSLKKMIFSSLSISPMIYFDDSDIFRRDRGHYLKVGKTIMQRFGNLWESKNNFEELVTGVDADRLRAQDYLIAAPQDDFKPDRFKWEEAPIQKIVEDPIVFQYTNIGIMVHDKWGEVTNDEIFKV